MAAALAGLSLAAVYLRRGNEWDHVSAKRAFRSDLSGAELCLRPDLTVPTCRYHLSHHADPRTEARYSYAGPAFRYFQPARS